MNKFSASGLDHKPLHVFRTQQEVAYVYIYIYIYIYKSYITLYENF